MLLTLVPLLLGMSMATVFDVTMNFIGTVFAGIAVAFTVSSQIFTNTYQKSLECNALQLLIHTSPIIAVGMLLLTFIFDNTSKLAAYHLYPLVVRDILLSCVFALGVNISNYLVLGKTSPLTYQVLGHLKTVLILVLGFTLFNKETNRNELLGICLAMVGVVSYTEVKRRMGTQRSTGAQSAPQLSSSSHATSGSSSASKKLTA